MRRLFIAAAMAMIAIMAFSVMAVAQEPTKVPLNAQNNSGQSGAATLTPMGDQTEVIIDIMPGPAGIAQPAHIHAGSCPNVGAVKYPLSAVMDGKSTTLVDASIRELEAGNMAINVHQSAQDISTYVACGNIPTIPAPASLPEAGDTTWPIVSAVVVIALALLGIGFSLQRRTA